MFFFFHYTFMANLTFTFQSKLLQRINKLRKTFFFEKNEMFSYTDNRIVYSFIKSRK